jgi:hemoglobin-like flavoprotein
VTPQQVALVQASFAKVAPIAEEAAALFYGRLFETAPETRALFTDDMSAQGQKLMAAISTVVTNLDDLGAIVPVAQELAKRHVGYGVRAEHYVPVGAALLWTLEKGLGDDFTADVGAAWAEAYTTVSQVMVAAAYSGS